MTVNDLTARMEEVTLVRLPSKLSPAVDQAVKSFIETHGDEKLHAYQRWQGADLWMVYSTFGSAHADAIVTRRVTIGSYSDNPEWLAFIPDMLVVRAEGRYIPPRQEKQFRDRPMGLSIFELTQYLMLKYGPPEDISSKVKDKLAEAWVIAKGFDAQQATILLP